MRFKYNRAIRDIIKRSGVNNHAVKFAVSEARRLMQEFVPMDTGKLAESAQESADESRGRVIYAVPYASRCYYGASLDFKREKNPGAGAFWDRAMMQVYKGALHASVSKFIKRG